MSNPNFSDPPSIRDLDQAALDEDSPKFDNVNALFREASEASDIVMKSKHAKHAIFKDTSGQPHILSKVIRLTDQYFLTPESLGVLAKVKIGHIVIMADQLDTLRFEDEETIDYVRQLILAHVIDDAMANQTV